MQSFFFGRSRDEVRELLFDAVIRSDAQRFRVVAGESPFLISDIQYPGGRSILHISAMYGTLDITKVILLYNARLAELVDNQGCTPLHLAAASGRHTSVPVLVESAPLARRMINAKGYNPAHEAAANGHMQVLTALLERDITPALDLVSPSGDTILHVCVAKGQTRALLQLLSMLPEAFIRRANASGDTLLHYCVRFNMPHMIAHLPGVPRRATNSDDQTAWQMARGMAAEVRRSLACPISELEETMRREDTIYWGLLTLAGLFATLTFQAVINPPGGVSSSDGKSVLSRYEETLYSIILCSNTISFLASLVAILFIFATARRRNRRLYHGAIVLVAFSTVFAAVSFILSTVVLTPQKKTWTRSLGIAIGVTTSLLVAMALANGAVANAVRSLSQGYEWLVPYTCIIRRRAAPANNVGPDATPPYHDALSELPPAGEV